MKAGSSEEASISRLLEAAERGEDVHVDTLLPLVYDQLRRMAQVQMGGERKDHTLQATALVHEAFLRLANAGRWSWKSKRHFYAAAAEAMRRILIDHARARGAVKRGGGFERAAISLADLVTNAPPDAFLALDEAMTQLAAVDGRAAAVAELRLYAGLSVAETAETLAVPLRTVERDWAYARVWLFERLH